MDTCPRCTKPLFDHREVCPHCGVMISFYDGPEVGPKAARKTKSVRARSVVEISAFPVAKVTLILFCLGLIAWALLPSQMEVVGLSPSAANETGVDACSGKERCVIVYLTPWCPVCRGTVPIVRGFIRQFANSSSVGVKPVVGGRNPKRMEELAAQIGRTSFLDRSGRFWAGTGAQSVPTWFVLDADGYVLEVVPGAYPTVQAMIEQLGLQDYR